MSINRTATVSYVRSDVIEASKQWYVIRDCIDGELAIKAKRTTYLPNPSNSFDTQEDVDRYNSYITRANFYNATKQTLKGLIGQVFTRKPLIEVPKQLDLIINDVDGSAIDLSQLSKIAINLTLAYGRSGILVDYSSSSELLTKEELSNGNARAILRIYNPWDIINWRYEIDDSNKRRLTLVVLKETYVAEDNGFSYTVKDQYRELRLVDGVYRVRIWRQGTKDSLWNYVEHFPSDYKGNNFDKILFTFIGAENNTGDIDGAPLYDLASINIAHYRNSADYEESVFMVGQPTPIVTGLDESWVKNVLKGGFKLGSRTAVPLPKNADCKLVAASENGLVKEAMDHKERQMVALGAKLVEQRQVQRTATEAGIEASAESSTLVSVANNVSMVIVQALMWASEFEGIENPDIKFVLNTDFALNKMTPSEVGSTIKSWSDGAISWDEMRINLRKGNIELLEDNAAKASIDAENAIKLKEEEKN